MTEQQVFQILYDWLDVSISVGTYQQFLLAQTLQLVCKLRPLPQFDELKRQFKRPVLWAIFKQIWTNSDHAEFWWPIEEASEFRVHRADTILGIRWTTTEPVVLRVVIKPWAGKTRVLEITEPFQLYFPYNAGFGHPESDFYLLNEAIPEGLEIKWSQGHDQKGIKHYTRKFHHQWKFRSVLDKILNLNS